MYGSVPLPHTIHYLKSGWLATPHADGYHDVGWSASTCYTHNVLVLLYAEHAGIALVLCRVLVLMLT